MCVGVSVDVLMPTYLHMLASGPSGTEQTKGQRRGGGGRIVGGDEGGGEGGKEEGGKEEEGKRRRKGETRLSPLHKQTVLWL